MINKDTLVFGSFSKKAGNVGCLFFNTEFQKRGINAIYKSFSIVSIQDAVAAAKCLGFSGFAVSMPFKTEIIQYLDEVDEIVKKTNSCNTVLIRNSRLFGYNTDYIAVNEVLSMANSPLYILGNGGYSKTVQFCARELGLSYEVITRETWDRIASIRNSTVFNCTPVELIRVDSSNDFIDCIVSTPTGADLALKQATAQLELYLAMSPSC
jgi:shikimate dehydrogenase